MFRNSVIILISISTVFAVSGFTKSRNYVAVIEAISASKDEPPPFWDLARVSVIYYDGLGRPIESIMSGAGGDLEDIITLTEYGDGGKISRQWQPVGMHQNAEFINSDAYKNNVKSFYGVDRAYTANQYAMIEGMPESQITKPGASKSVTKEHDLCWYGECKIFDVDEEGRLVKNGYYQDGMLRTEWVIDEKNRTTITYTDFDGNIVMIKDDENETYYVRDVCGRLRYVLSPEAANRFVTNGVCDSDIVAKYCTAYNYDERGRVVEMRPPGLNPAYYIYDRSGNLIFKQEYHIEGSKAWQFFAYDSKNRLALSGRATLKTAMIRDQIAEHYKDTTVVAVFDRNIGLEMSLCYRLENLGLFNSFDLEREKAYFYDDYEFWTREWNLPDVLELKHTPATSRMGKPTGSAVLDGFPTATLNIYDGRGREIARQERHYAGEFIKKTYYTLDYVGNVTEDLTITEFPFGEYQMNPDTVTMKTRFNHNYCWNIIDGISTSIDGGKSVNITYWHDAVNRVVRKTDSSRKGQISYTYDVQNRLTAISCPQFEENIQYSDDGLISGKTAVIKNGTATQSQEMEYLYDWNRRLIAATNTISPYPLKPEMFTEEFEYDRNGNITSLTRGHYDGFLQNAEFIYDGNRISRIEDSSDDLLTGDAPRFASGIYDDPYSYSLTGLFTKDDTRGISKINYNYDRLPIRIEFDNGNSITRRYLPGGEKRGETESIKYMAAVKRIVDGKVVIEQRPRYKHRIREYYGSVERENGKTRKVYAAGTGFWMKDDSGQWCHYRYVMNFAGSPTVILDDGDKAVQSVWYYASGLPVVTNYGTVDAVDDKLHGGKEFSEFSGMYYYDNEARQYDPVTMRFTSMDPLFEKYPSLSPYAYCANNPLMFSDPTGMEIKTDPTDITFNMKFAVVRKYLKDNGLYINGQKIADDEKRVLTILNSKRYNRQNEFDPMTGTLYLNLDEALELDNQIFVSPAVVLEHELDHVQQQFYNPQKYGEDVNTKHPDYENEEERRVIEGAERVAAERLGEIEHGGRTRYNHNVQAYIPVDEPTKNKMEVEPKKEIRNKEKYENEK